MTGVVARQVVRVVHSFHSVRTFRVAQLVVQLVRVACPVAERLEAALSLVTGRMARQVVRVVHPFHAVRTSHVAQSAVLPAQLG